MKLVRWACLFLLVLSDAVSAAGPKRQDLWLHGRIDIDVDGRVAGLSWDTLPPLQKLVADRITPKVKSWEFVPATIDGKPLPTRTGLMVHLQAIEGGNGAIELRFIDAHAGAMVANQMPPPYPREAIVAGVSAMVVVEVSVAADGLPIVHDLRYRADSGAKRHRKLFLDAVQAGMKAWRFHPEVVAGQSTGAKLSLPVIFCLEPAWCTARYREAKALTRSETSTLSMAPNSVVALKTRIAEGDI